MQRTRDLTGRGRSTIGAGGVFLAALALLSGCGAGGLLSGLAIPIAYQSATLVAGDRGTLHATAGLYVELSNVSAKTIAEVVLAFDLYRDDEPLPAAGANSFAVAVKTSLAPGDTGSFCVSLDTVAGAADDGVVARRVRARSVTFADGTRWRNTGAHVYREAAS